MNHQQTSQEIEGFNPIETKELLFHVDNLFHTRFNFFITVEAILFAALGAFWNENDLMLASSIFGILFTILLGLTNINLSKSLKWLIDTYKNSGKSNIFKGFKKIKTRFVPRTLLLYTYLIPGMALIAWICALIYYLLIGRYI